MKRFLRLLFAFCTFGARCAPAQVRDSLLVESPDGTPVRAYADWTVFLHPRFGYELPVPPGVRALGNPEAATETTFVSPDRSFVMCAWGGLSPLSPTSVLEAQWRRAQSRPGRAINYQRKGRSWFVVSGTDKEGTEFYEKFIMHGDHVAACTLTYPRSRLREFEPWVEEIEDGFRVVALPHSPPEFAPRLLSGSARTGGGIVERPNVPSRVIPQFQRSGDFGTNERSSAQNRGVGESMVDLTPPGKRPGTGTETAATTLKRESGIPEDPGMASLEKQPDAGTTSTAEELPVGQKVVGKPGFVYSPFRSTRSLVDVVDIPSGTKVKCPYTGKIFRVP